MQLKWGAALVVLVAVSIRSGASHAETPEEWIKLGARVHGAFGAFLPAGVGVRYSVADEWLPKIIGWNKDLDPAGRYWAAMSAPGLFEVRAAP